MLVTLLASKNKVLRTITLCIRMQDIISWTDDENAEMTAEVDALLVDVVARHKGCLVRLKYEVDEMLTQEQRDTFLKRAFPLLMSSGICTDTEEMGSGDNEPTFRSYLPYDF